MWWRSRRLDPKLRYEATSFLSLVRNVGSSIGISIFEALITTQTQVEHSVLAGFTTPLNRALQHAPGLSLHTPHGIAMLNQMVTYQAEVIAYKDDFWLMAIMSAPIMLMLFFMTKPKPTDGGGHAAVMD